MSATARRASSTVCSHTALVNHQSSCVLVRATSCPNAQEAVTARCDATAGADAAVAHLVCLQYLSSSEPPLPDDI
jgi:hypothetical protein